MAEVKRLQCDAKGCEVLGAQVKRFVVTYPDGVLNVDLCPKHAESLTEIRALVPAGLFVKTKPHKGRPSTQFRKHSIEEIERQLGEAEAGD